MCHHHDPCSVETVDAWRDRWMETMRSQARLRVRCLPYDGAVGDRNGRMPVY